MAMNRANIDYSGQLLQTWLDRTVLENFEPELRFYDMWKKPAWKPWYNTLAWTRMNKSLVTPATATLTEWVTPNSTDLQMTTISLTATQYGLYATITDLLEDVSPIPMVQESLKILWQNMARIIDGVIQDSLSTNWTNVIYPVSTYTARSDIQSTDYLTPALLAQANAFLSTKASPTFGNSYIAVMHPNVIYDIMTGSSTGAFLDLAKYTESGRGQIVAWEIGMLYNVRVVKSAYVQTFSSTTTVYPTYVMGEGAYGVADLQSLRTYLTPATASDSDPLAQRRKVGCKVAFWTIILQQDALVRIESASSLSYTW